MGAGFWLETLKQRDCLVGFGIDGRIILKWIIKLEWQDIS
jgi:hypothetical protein